jgi:hypothetical protein
MKAMKNNKFFITTLILIVGLYSCERDLFDKVPLDSYSDGVVWSDPNLVELFVNDQYKVFPAHGFGFEPLALSSACDESIHQYGYLGITIINSGGLEPSNTTDFCNYEEYYKYIQKCNIFLERIDEVPGNQDIIDRMKGEILFIRAYCYQELVKRFAGVPIIDVAFELGDDYVRDRSSFEDCIDFIVADCDEATSLLPEIVTGEDIGRATSGAAMALKARVLLYAASDLFNPVNPNVTQPEYGYTSGNQADRYALAMNAAKAVIDLKTYQLYTGDYADIFTEITSELIFFKRIDPLYAMKIMAVENVEGPNGGIDESQNYEGWNTNSPSQNLVDAFGMSDGLSITESPLYDPQHPYWNRDPRFYTDINYDSALWHGAPLQFYDFGRNSPLYPGNPDAKNCSRTGYTLRKHLKEDYDYVTAQYVYGQPFPYLRLTEMYLIYAEAAYHTSDEGEARWAINQLRSRLSPAVPDVPAATTGDDLKDLIRRERRVELCFEGHRYFDVRRWMIAEETENTPLKGIHIVLDEVTGVKTYAVRDVQDRVFVAPQHYLFPIPKSELDKIALSQNPGY